METVIVSTLLAFVWLSSQHIEDGCAEILTFSTTKNADADGSLPVATSQTKPSVATNVSSTAATRPVPVYKIRKSIIDNLFNKYEKSVRPYPVGDGPTIVTVSLFVRRVSSIIEIAMEFTADLLIRQSWNDPRLRFNVSDNVSIPYVKLSVEAARRLWVPDLFFPFEKRGSLLHTITTPNVMLRVHPDGTVLYSERYSLVSSCDMNLFRYPFDVQRCLMQLGSFSDTTDDIQFVWTTNNSIIVNRETKMPKYYIGNIQTLPCSNVHPTGNFSCLRGEFEFRRQLGYFILESYLPLSLLVVASWLGFWIDASSVPGRVSLSVTTLLTTVAQASNIKATLPPVSYIKAIDIWLGICVLYAFAALAEFAFVNFLSRREAHFKAQKWKRNDETTHGNDEAALNPLSGYRSSLACCAKRVTTPLTSRKQNGDVHESTDDEETEESSRLKSWQEKVQRTSPRSREAKTQPRLIRCNSKWIDKTSRLLFPLSFAVVASLYVYIFVVHMYV